MGGKYSALPAVPADFPYFVLDFRTRDTIQISLADATVLETVTSAVQTVWSSGVERQGRLKDGSYEIRFFPSLFSNSSYHVCCILTKRVVCKILMELYRTGWQPVVASSLSRTSKLSTWFFYKFRSKLRPKPIVCLALSSSDRIQLINGPENLKRTLKEAVRDAYVYGMLDEFRYGDDYEIKLKGKPWNSYVFEEGVWARKLILEIVRKFSEVGYQFYTAANTTATADCLFFLPRDQWKLRGVEYFLLSLNQTDKIRLIGLPQSRDDDGVLRVCRDAIVECWPKGIQTDSDLGIAYEFQLKGNPWVSTDRDSVASRLLMTKLMERLLTNGWRVCAGVSISNRNNDKGVLILRSSEGKSLEHASISFNRNDRVRLVNFADDDVESVARVVEKRWPYGVRKIGNYFGCTEIKMKGNPWAGVGGNEYAMARCVACFLLKELMANQWRIVTSVDLSGRYGGAYRKNQEDQTTYPLGVHTWFFAKILNASNNNNDQPDLETTTSSPEGKSKIASISDVAL